MVMVDHISVNKIQYLVCKSVEGRKVYLTMTDQFIYGKEENVLFNDTLKIFYLWLYGIRHMAKYHTDS